MEELVGDMAAIENDISPIKKNHIEFENIQNLKAHNPSSVSVNSKMSNIIVNCSDS